MDTQRQASPFARKNVVYVCAAFCCLLWGSAYPAIKSGYDLFQIATDDIPSKIVFAGYRFLFAGFGEAIIFARIGDATNSSSNQQRRGLWEI